MTSYPILQKYLGNDSFAQLSHDYIDQYPSCYRSIRWYGDQLALFLSQHTDYREFPYFAELAEVEWAMTTVFDAADANPLSLADIAAIPPDAWENMCFQVHPATFRLTLKWNVISIWQALSE